MYISAEVSSEPQLASQERIPHPCSLLLGNQFITVVQDVAIPHANAAQTFRFHRLRLGTDALWIIVPNLMDLSFLVLRGEKIKLHLT